jgi:hypothetical protein
MGAMAVPSFAGNISFNAQHSPAGAFMSFTCGHFGSGGGIGVEIGRPANQNVYVGIKRGDRTSKQPFRCLPFVRRGSFTSAAASFQVDQAKPTAPDPLPPGVQCYDASEIRRHYGWASDAWVTPDFSFTIYTPFAPLPDPATAEPAALREALLPAVVATLTIDNQSGDETKTAVFALDFPEAGTRLIRAAGDDATAAATISTAARAKFGFAWRRDRGVLGMLEGAAGDDRAFAFQRWSVAEGVSDANPVHEMGSCGGIAVEVPPGESRTLVLAIGVYLDGIVTTGIEARYYYTRCYASLDDVLSAALDASPALRARAAKLDARLLASGVSADQQFLIAPGTRGYYGSTQLLDVGGEPLFVVNEGEYCMMNTLDLAVDHAFWELEHNPWVVRNILDQLARRYSYHDQVRVPRSNELLPGGVSFCHDVGVNNTFSRPGHSSYELPHLTGCFSYMTQEQLCNWVLLACGYVVKTGDVDWLTENAHLLAACGQSMRNPASERTGIMAYDTARCLGGQEITTYDSLDESLGQARANTYLAAKCWATWLGLEMLARLRDASRDGEALAELEPMTDQLAVCLSRAARPDGTIPAVLEKDNPGFQSRILPVIEALIYPHYWLACARAGGRAKFPAAAADDVEAFLASALRDPLIAVLKRHALELLTDPKRRTLFPDGGIKLSSTSNNSWMSKIAVVQHVARQVLRLHEEDDRIAALFSAADAAHVKWQTEGGAYWACSDQFVSGIAKASRYYPRIITTALWLSDAPRSAPTARPRPTPVVTTTLPAKPKPATPAGSA